MPRFLGRLLGLSFSSVPSVTVSSSFPHSYKVAWHPLLRLALPLLSLIHFAGGKWTKVLPLGLSSSPLTLSPISKSKKQLWLLPSGTSVENNKGIIFLALWLLLMATRPAYFTRSLLRSVVPGVNIHDSGLKFDSACTCIFSINICWGVTRCKELG